VVLRRWIAVVRTGVVWGAAWFVVATCFVTVALLTGIAPTDATWFRAFGMAMRIGVVGGMAGALVAGTTALFYRGRRLRDMHWITFGVAGAVVTAVGMPLVLQMLNILSGDGPVAWHYLTDDIPWMGVMGGAVSAAWLALAQRAESRDAGRQTAATTTPALAAAVDAATVALHRSPDAVQAPHS
jgi:hypothetical protein